MCEHMEQVKNAQRTLKKEEVCIQCSSEMLQILLYFMCKKSHAVVFSFFNSCIPYEQWTTEPGKYRAYRAEPARYYYQAEPSNTEPSLTEYLH